MVVNIVLIAVLLGTVFYAVEYLTTAWIAVAVFLVGWGLLALPEALRNLSIVRRERQRCQRRKALRRYRE